MCVILYKYRYDAFAHGSARATADRGSWRMGAAVREQIARAARPVAATTSTSLQTQRASHLICNFISFAILFICRKGYKSSV